MIFYCYSETCHVEHDCDCDNRCCSGLYYSPAVYTLDDENLSEKQKMEMVLHHMCPQCTGWVEA